MSRIVLADDDEDLRSVYASALHAVGHEVFEAADGRAAIDLTRSERPDLLLLDIWMPALNGFEVLDALRHDSVGIRLRIVVISNLADAEARLEAFEAGACEYIVKGGPLTDLLRHIHEILDQADAVALD